MPTFAQLLPQALALAASAGVSTYATVALLGLTARLGWVGELPPALGVLGNWWIIGLAAALYAVEFLATLIPGVASAWEAMHSALRPLAGTALAVATAWQADPVVIAAAGLLGGAVALGTQATKLGARVVIDTSPEPVTNGIANVAEAGFVASIVLLVWQHPWLTVTLAACSLVAVALLVRVAWRTVAQLFGRRARD